MLELNCLVLGETEDDIFSLEIDAAKFVSVLKKLIKEENQYSFPAKALKLWKVSKPYDEIKDLTELPDGETLMPTKKLSTIFPNHEVGENVDIIIKLPGPPTAPPTVIKRVHPSPLRRKRFDDINSLLSKRKMQKKKDKATGADASILWSEIESVYTQIIKEVNLKPRPIPDHIVDVLYNHLQTISRALGDILTGKPEAKRLYFIGAILFYFVAITDGDGTEPVDILIEESVTGENINVDGKFEFVIRRGNKKICIVKAKKDVFKKGMTQDLLGCEAVADIESSSCVYGIATNYLNWVFFRSLDDRIERDIDTLVESGENTIKVGTRSGLKRVLGKIYALLFDESE